LYIIFLKGVPTRLVAHGGRGKGNYHNQKVFIAAEGGEMLVAETSKNLQSSLWWTA
jgi:hypothetical protein